MFRWNFRWGSHSVCVFVFIASCPVSGHYWKEPGSLFSTPSFHQVLTHIDEFHPLPPDLLFSRLSSPCLLAWQMLQFLICHITEHDLLQQIHSSLVLGSPKLALHSRCDLTSAENHWRLISLNLLAVYFLMQSRMPGIWLFLLLWRICILLWTSWGFFSFVHPVMVPLDSGCFIRHPSEFCVTCKTANGALCPTWGGNSTNTTQKKPETN